MGGGVVDEAGEVSGAEFGSCPQSLAEELGFLPWEVGSHCKV